MENIKKMWQEIFNRLSAQVRGAKNPMSTLRKIDELGRHLIMGKEIYKVLVRQSSSMLPSSSGSTHWSSLVGAPPPRPVEPKVIPKPWHQEDDANVAFATFVAPMVGEEPDEILGTRSGGLRDLLKKICDVLHEPIPPLPPTWWRKPDNYSIFVGSIHTLLGLGVHPRPNLSYLLRDLEVALGLAPDQEGKHVGVRRPVLSPIGSSVVIEKVGRLAPKKYQVALAKAKMNKLLAKQEKKTKKKTKKA